MKPKYSTLLLLLATIGCKQEVMAQVKPGYCAASPDSKFCPDKQEPFVEKGDGGDRIPLQVGTNLDGSYIFTENFAKSVSVESRESTAVKLSDEEYSNLQKLRQAVVDEERRLAVKYGAWLNYGCGEAGDICKWTDGWRPDTYTFHQQFLLIDKAEQYVYGITGTLSPESLKKFGPPDNVITIKPKQWSPGISPLGEEWIKKHSDSDQMPLILNRFPDGSVLKGTR